MASMQSICLEGFGGENVVDPRLQDTTFIQHTFGGCLRSKVTDLPWIYTQNFNFLDTPSVQCLTEPTLIKQVMCLRCHHESERYEKMMDLTLEIFGWVESLEDALMQFTSLEDLDGDNMYRCARCVIQALLS